MNKYCTMQFLLTPGKSLLPAGLNLPSLWNLGKEGKEYDIWKIKALKQPDKSLTVDLLDADHIFISIDRNNEARRNP